MKDIVKKTMDNTENKLPDIKPQTPIAYLDRDKYLKLDASFTIENVCRVVGMSKTFVRKVCGRKQKLDTKDVLLLLDQDSFSETIVPRSKVFDYLIGKENKKNHSSKDTILENQHVLTKGDAIEVIESLPKGSIKCVVTSTPYWALRIYKEPHYVSWSDGESCPYGHEQTPEGFVRHTTEILASLYDILDEEGSIWWNVMDTFNTRTQIRGNASEALRAMQGKDGRSWGDHECRRYSAGHSYLKDGEQCLIPSLIAERASRLGFYVKTVITWSKTSSLPEPQDSRVSRNLEYILHLTKIRTPSLDKSIYRTLPAALGGRNNGWETNKLSDVWTLPTSSGRDGHGAQFPIALPGRCIALSTKPGDVVLDPFVGAGNAGVAAVSLDRKFIGIDVSEEYLATAERKISAAEKIDLKSSTTENETQPMPGILL